MQTILLDGVATVIDGDFEWDESKAESNLAKHGVSFAEAATVFADPVAVYLDDGSDTDRTVVIGTSFATACSMSFTSNVAGEIASFSARPATRAERDVYETGGDA